jgi:hypothetical protein
MVRFEERVRAPTSRMSPKQRVVNAPSRLGELASPNSERAADRLLAHLRRQGKTDVLLERRRLSLLPEPKVGGVDDGIAVLHPNRSSCTRRHEPAKLAGVFQSSW